MLKLVVVLCVMLDVAFLTLLERKVLGLRQVRLGVNKVVVFGLVQPLLDAIKLLTKEMVLLEGSVTLVYLLSPSIMLVLSFLL